MTTGSVATTGLIRSQNRLHTLGRCRRCTALLVGQLEDGW